MRAFKESERLKILLTRADNEMLETAATLTANGFEVLACPLAQVTFEPPTFFNPETYQKILLTSRNGVRALTQWTTCRHIPLGVVGAQTAALAREMGFLQVHDAGGTVMDLISYVQKTCHPAGKPLFYGRGEHVRHDLKSALKICHFCIEEKIFYALQGIPNLPSLMVELLMKREVWGAVFLSQSSANHFKSLIMEAGLASVLKSVYFFGLSPTVLIPLKEWGRALLTPEKPRLDLLIHLLNTTRL